MNYTASAKKINSEIAQILGEIESAPDPVSKIRLVCKFEALAHQLTASAGRMISAD